MDSLECVSLVVFCDCYYNLCLKVKSDFELKNEFLNKKTNFKLHIL